MRWLREPLVHFLALGAGLFLVFSWIGDSDDRRSDEIVVSAVQVELLAEGFARTWQRPPTSQELAGLVDDHIREEVYYREAQAMGLDRDDTIIRRRLRQKMEFFTDDLLAAVDPPEEALRDYLTENPGKFRVEARVTFEHIYFNSDRRGVGAADDAEELLVQLRDGESGLNADALGDRLPLPRQYPNAPVDRIGGRFGVGFAESLMQLPVGTWSGPVQSGYGLHLVLISELVPGEVPPFEEIREVVEREWRADERAAAKEAFFQALRQRYSVVVEEPGVSGADEDAVGTVGSSQ